MTVDKLIRNLKIEIKSQEERYSVSGSVNLKQLRTEGYLLQPIRINRKSYGFADYPEFDFSLPYPAETNQFKNGSAIQLFCGDEKPISGVLLYLEENRGEVRLYASDFPDWIEDKNCGIQLIIDQRTNQIQLDTLKNIQKSKKYLSLFEQFHSPYEDKGFILDIRYQLSLITSLLMILNEQQSRI